MTKKSLLMILITCSLSACTSVLVHEPLDCLGQPVVSLNFTIEEFKTIPKTAKKKIVVFGKALRARIDAQCELSEVHNLKHSD